MTFRVMAQDVLSREWLDMNVQLNDPQIIYNLTGPNEIRGALTPERPNLGFNAYDSWKTFLHVEQDGYIRCSGIINPVSISGQSIDISAMGVTDYPNGIPFMGAFSGIQVDPLDVTRTIWDHVQSYPDSNLGVTLDNTTSDVTIGTEKQEANFETSQGEDVSFQTNDGPYRLNWWNHQDCGKEINSLAKETPFDFREDPHWNADKTDVVQHVRLGYPRLGERRENVHFLEGTNVTSTVPVTEMDDQYASAVVVLGAGEGRKMVRGTASLRSPRLRRVVVLTQESIERADRARAIAQEELKRRQARNTMSQVTVNVAHRNSQWGAFNEGDDVLVTGDIPWIGRTSIWHRITSIAWSPVSDSADVKLIPSESVTYTASRDL